MGGTLDLKNIFEVNISLTLLRSSTMLTDSNIHCRTDSLVPCIMSLPVRFVFSMGLWDS